MARAASGIDYLAELSRIRDAYISATPRQRLSIARQRLEDHHFGPNRLVTSVSAVEALSRCLLLHLGAKSKEPLLKSEWVHSGAFVVVLEVALDDRRAVRDGVGNQRAVVRDRHRLQCASADFDDPCRLCIRQPLRGCGRGRRASSPRYGVETLSASEL